MKYAFYILVLFFAAGCAAQSDAGLQGTDNIGQPPVRDQPQELLLENDVMGANELYMQAYADDASDMDALAGKIITDILLLPYSNAVSKVLTENLGASGRLGRDGDDVIYGDQGFLYFAARGTPWNPEPGGLSGIRSILADRLPWDETLLSNEVDFVSMLDRPVDLLTSNLVGVADELGAMTNDLGTVVRSEPFESFFLPGEVFHNGNIAIRFSKVELAVLQGAIEGLRTGIYFVAAYEHAWNLSAAFGPQWDIIAADSNHPDYIAGYDYEDYSISYLNPFLAHNIKDAGRLTKAGNAFVASIGGFQNALKLAQTEDSPYLNFGAADPDALTDLNNLLDAVKRSVDGSVVIPNSSPETTLNLSVVFTDGRTLSAETDLFEQVTDEFDTYWDISEMAADELTLGILTPNDYEYTPIEDIGNALETIFESLENDVSGTF